MRRLLVVFSIVITFSTGRGVSGGTMPEPLFHYTFEENTNDVAGGHHGTLLGDASYSTNVPPAYGGQHSLSLDGSLDKMIYIPTASDAVKGSFTITAWANVTEHRPGGTLGIIGSRTPEDHGLDLKYRLDQTIRLDIGDGTQWLTISDHPVDYRINEWHHVAVSVEPGNYRLYFDGNLVGQAGMGNGTPVLLDSQHNLAVGAIYALNQPNGGAAGEDFIGLLDDVRIYDVTLSQSQIHSIVPEPAVASLLSLTLPLCLGSIRRRFTRASLVWTCQ